MYRICAETRIAAPAGAVYGAVADLPNYSRWNPWCTRCEGGSEVKVGAVFTVTVQLRGKPMTVRHQIIAMQPDTHFAWCDLGWFTHFAYGERSRYFEPDGAGGTRCRVELRLSGPLAWLAQRLYGAGIRAGMAQELEGLKKHVEAGAA